MPPTLRPLLLIVLSLALTGCATKKKAVSTLSWLRGKPVLVVSEGLDAPQEREQAITRALSTAPVRAWPSDADGSLQSTLDDAAERLAAAREEAEERRIPWLVVAEADRLRVENARGGEVRWASEPRPGLGPGAVSEVITGAVGPPEEPAEGLASEPARLCPHPRLATLRDLAVQGEWETHRAQVDELAQAFPADPALMVHGALAQLLTEDPDARAEAALRRAVQANPDGESELLALALLAEDASRTGFALRARAVLVRLYPERIDYRPELADLHGELDAPEEALGVLRGGLAFVDVDAVEELARGTAPHDAPSALPYADLRFHLGWYLAQVGDPEPALLAYEQALRVYEVMGRPKEHSDAVNNAGVVLVEAGRPAIAVPLFRKARRLRTDQGRQRRAANSAHNLARALADSRRISEALDAYEDAAAAYEELGDPLAAVESLYETLEHYAKAGDSDALERRSDELLARLEEAVGDGPGTASLRGLIWFERGRGRMVLRDPEGALEAYTVALDVYRRQGARLDEAQTLYSMAVPNMALLRLEDAYGNLVEALELAVELNDSASIIDIREQVLEVADLIRGAGRTPPPLPDTVVPYME